MRRLLPIMRRDVELSVTTLNETSQPPPPGTTRRRLFARMVTSLLVVAVVATFLAGVATNHIPSFSSGSTTVAPKRGGSIVDGSNFEPESLLPWRVDLNVPLAQALWAPLWYGDPQGAFHPAIATEVPSLANGGISADLTTWTIHLRPGLKWSDGTPLTAEDCAFSFNLYADPAYQTGFPSADPSDPVGFAGAIASDSSTFVLQFRHSIARLLVRLADAQGTCVPKHVFETMTPAQAAASPENFSPTVTSGPFMVKERVGGDHMTVVRNPDYYQPDKPYLDQITFKFLSNHVLSSTEILHKLQTDAVDTYWQLDPTLLSSYRAIPGDTTYLDPYPAWYEVLAFNLTNPLLSDLAVRQAITMGIDRNTIIATILHGTATLTCDDSVGTLAHEANLNCYAGGPRGAAALLDADGWTMGTDGYRHKNGQALELAYATTTNRPFREATQALIHDELEAIGIKIDLKAYTPGEFFNQVLPSGNFQIGEFANNNNYDPDDSFLFRSDQTAEQGGINFMHYANPQVDQLEQDQVDSADMTARRADFHLIHADILRDLPVMYLYAPLAVSCARSDLRNYEPSPEGVGETWNVWDWWLAPQHA